MRTKLTAILKEVFGQEFYESASILASSTDLSLSEQDLVQNDLNESVMHKLVNVKDVSRISLVSGLTHPN